MNPTPKLYELLYVSTLASTTPINSVASIAATSRAWNGSHAITGLLIFDGMRFCQQIEGGRQDVLALFEKISCDARHAHVKLIHHGPLPARRFNSFSLAFTSVDDIEVLSRLEALRGEPGISAFGDLLSNLDLEG